MPTIRIMIGFRVFDFGKQCTLYLAGAEPKLCKGISDFQALCFDRATFIDLFGVVPEAFERDFMDRYFLVGVRVYGMLTDSCIWQPCKVSILPPEKFHFYNIFRDSFGEEV